MRDGEPSQSSLRDARFPLLSPAVTFSPGRGKSVLSGGALLALTGRCVKAPPFGGAGAGAPERVQPLHTSQQKPCVSAAGALLYIIYIIERCERSPDP